MEMKQHALLIRIIRKAPARTHDFNIEHEVCNQHFWFIGWRKFIQFTWPLRTLLHFKFMNFQTFSSAPLSQKKKYSRVSLVWLGLCRQWRDSVGNIIETHLVFQRWNSIFNTHGNGMYSIKNSYFRRQIASFGTIFMSILFCSLF